ncbi:MAG: response regulator [Candidatus Marinimicrobia bacterium]|nr:response regulator [Candidatus Neomarinimicrobiota bacterium]MCF7829724.1 response regulator [Candidatus Neomarinimicrobiota bacterium]MCF7881674.1 response regulator [Candidatus Neomarinimicrobiota bacterium]
MNRIALVEDNPDNRLLVCAILEDDYNIDEYENGKEALEGIAAHPPDLILLDISLPEMDGTEVLQNIRSTDTLAEIPAIALTAHAMTGDREKFLSMGFDEYITKPIVDEDELLNVIHRFLEL